MIVAVVEPVDVNVVGGGSVVVMALAWSVPHAVFFFLLSALSDVPARVALHRMNRGVDG